MHDGSWSAPHKRLAQMRFVTDFTDFECPPFDRLRIATRQIVIRDRIKSGTAQSLARVAADEARATSHQNRGHRINRKG